MSDKFDLKRLFFPSVMLVMFLVSVAAMINGIFSESLLHDESLFARNIALFPIGIRISAAPSAPLFYTLTYGLVQLFGKHEWVYRLLPLLGGITCLGLMVIEFTRRFSKPAAFFTSFLLAISFRFIHFSGNAHPYAMDAAVSAVLLVLALRVLEKPVSRNWWYWQIAAIFSILLSFSAFFVVGAMGGYLVVNDSIRNQRKIDTKMVLRFIPLLLVMGTVFAFFYFQQSHNREDISGWTYTFPPLLHLFELFKWTYFKTIDLFGFLFWYGYSGIAGLFLALIGIAAGLKKKPGIILLCLGPWVVSYVAAFFQKWPYGPVRTSLFLLPLLATIFGYGIDFIWNAMSERRMKFMAALAFTALLIPSLWTWKFAFITMEDGEEAVKTLTRGVEPKIEADDSFIVYYAANTQFQFYFPEYLDRSSIMTWDHRGNREMIENYVIRNLPAPGKRFWIITSHVVGQADRWMAAAAAANGTALDSVSAAGCGAILYRRLDPSDK